MILYKSTQVLISSPTASILAFIARDIIIKFLALYSLQHHSYLLYSTIYPIHRLELFSLVVTRQDSLSDLRQIQGSCL